MAVIAWLAGFLRVFWICRVSVVNVVVGVLFFWAVMQAQNLMADLSSWGSFAEFAFWAGVFASTFLLWAFPVHYGARRSLDQLVRMAPVVAVQQCWLIAQLPRALGLMPFVALALGIRGARTQAAGAAHLLQAAATTMTQGLWLYAADAVTAVLFVVFVYLRRKWVPPEWNGKVIYPVALGVTAAVFVACYIAPLATSVHIPRALLVPPLFGSLVLAASWLTRLGDRTGFPFLATVALLLGLSTGLNVHFNDLRTLPGTPDERVDIATALERWKAANDCSASTPPKACLHPIVVAIDGGASRAAFTAATFVGEFLDRMPKYGAGEAHTPGRRIFAISGVSGGAYGAAVIQSALLDGQRAKDDGTPPCRSAQTTWFGYDDWLGQKTGDASAGHEAEKTFTWRQCLQALTSGDYLTGTIIGLAFRDFAAPPWQSLNLPPMVDRAAILEMTWERQYAATLEAGRPFFEGGDLCRDDADSGFCRRMAHPKPHLDGGRWMPLLLLNSTSVATGRRVIASDLKSTMPTSPAIFSGSLSSQAFDLREAMSEPCLGSEPDKDATARCVATPPLVDGPDVRLSTAALTSARFPVASPAGVFHMGAIGHATKESSYGDQLVDGGYFENSGLTTALDIVHALEAFKLEPTLISISNNPAYGAQDIAACNRRFGEAREASAEPFFPGQCAGLPPRPAATPLVGLADDSFLGRFFAIFSRPFQTLVAAGDGHSDELIALILANEPRGGFYHFKVEVAPNFGGGAAAPPSQTGPLLGAGTTCDRLPGRTMTMAEVSMSWWLGAAAQADIDIQRCTEQNRRYLDALVDRLQQDARPQ